VQGVLYGRGTVLLVQAGGEGDLVLLVENRLARAWLGGKGEGVTSSQISSFVQLESRGMFV
jgi:hypothetical protein